MSYTVSNYATLEYVRPYRGMRTLLTRPIARTSSQEASSHEQVVA